MSKKNVNPGSRPWDLRKGESLRAYQSFEIYCEMGPFRSLAKLGQSIGKHRNHFNHWSVKYEWSKRCRAYDGWIAAQKTESTEDSLVEMVRQHKELVSNLRSVIAAPVKVLLRKLESCTNSMGEVKLKELDGMSFLELFSKTEPLLRHAITVIRLERLLAGLPSSENLEAIIRKDDTKVKNEICEYVVNIPPARLAEIVVRAQQRLKDRNGDSSR